MATFVQGGADLLDVMGGGFISRGVETFLDSASQAVQNLLPQSGQDFIRRWSESYKTLDINGAMAMLANLNKKSDSSWDNYTVRLLADLSSLQTAGPVMQRWVMAHPGVRDRYLNNSLSGYEGSYQNFYGDVIGEDHADYRMVMNGVGQLVNGSYQQKRFTELIVEGDVELRPVQQLSILQTWDFLSAYLPEADEDPTCELGSPM